MLHRNEPFDIYVISRGCFTKWPPPRNGSSFLGEPLARSDFQGMFCEMLPRNEPLDLYIEILNAPPPEMTSSEHFLNTPKKYNVLQNGGTASHKRPNGT